MPTRPTLLLGVAFLASSLAALPLRADPRYEPGLTHHPRLGLDGRDSAHLSRLVGHIDRQEAPWAAFYASEHGLAVNGGVRHHGEWDWRKLPDCWVELYGQEVGNGRVAGACALIAYLYSRGLDPAWLPLPRRAGETTPDGWLKERTDRAALIIRRMYEDWPAYKGFGVINRGIVAAESLVVHLQAYDLLQALPAHLKPDLSGCEARLAELASDLDYWGWTVDTYQNNHGIRVDSALGMAAIGLNRLDVYRWWKPGTWWHKPKGWMREAEQDLGLFGRGSTFRFQSEHGAWAEGTSYFQYSSDLMLPFFFSYNRFLGGRGTPWMASDRLARLVDWGIGTRFPDGRRPGIDNAQPHRTFVTGMFVNAFPGGASGDAQRIACGWDFADNGYPGSRPLDLLAAYDPDAGLSSRIQAFAHPPGHPARIQPLAGTAVLRSGWGKQDAHLLLLAENGPAHYNGDGHNDADPLHVTFTSGSEPVLVDPGYGGFTKVRDVHAARHHSLILVDGKGPRDPHQLFGIGPWQPGGVEAFMVAGSRTHTGVEVSSVEGVTRYCDTTLDRTALLAEDRYAVLEDRVRSQRSRPALDFLVQCNVGPSGLSLLADGAEFVTRTAGLPVRIAAQATVPLTYDRRSGMDYAASPPEHAVFVARGAGRAVRFLTAVTVGTKGGAAPSITVLARDAHTMILRVEDGGNVDIIISNESGRAVTCQGGPVAGTIATDASLLVASFRVHPDRPRWYRAVEASFVRFERNGVTFEARGSGGTLERQGGVETPPLVRK